MGFFVVGVDCPIGGDAEDEAGGKAGDDWGAASDNTTGFFSGPYTILAPRVGGDAATFAQELFDDGVTADAVVTLLRG